MSTWNTGNFTQKMPPKVVKPKQPTEEQFIELRNKYIEKMQHLWFDYYREYAELYHLDFGSLVWPTAEQILEQFGDILTKKRGIDFPEHKTEKASITYGDFKRQRGPAYDDDSMGGNFNNKRARNDNDNGWGDEVTPVLSTNTFNREKTWHEFDRNQNNRDPRKTNYGERNQESNFRGGFRGRGGRARGGSFRGRNDSNRFSSYGATGFSSNSTGASGGTGWSDDEDSNKTKKNNGSNNNADGWDDDKVEITQKKTENITVGPSTNDWDDEPTVAAKKTEILTVEQTHGEWDDNEPMTVKKAGTQETDAKGNIDSQACSIASTQSTCNWVIDTQAEIMSTQSEAPNGSDDWD